jgi:hypothetical protein
VANPKTPGDEFFENYCGLNGYLVERDVDWRARFGVETDKDPDYLIDRAGDRAIVEVKHFTVTRFTERLLASPTRTASFGGRDLWRNLYDAITSAGAQLAPFADLGLPLVALMTNPTHSDVNFHPDDVVSALFGQVEYQVTFDEDDVEADASTQALFGSGDGAVLAGPPENRRNRLPHLSAAIALFGLPDYPLVNVYDLAGAPGFTGTPLPRTMFDADNDIRMAFLDEQRFGQI